MKPKGIIAAGHDITAEAAEHILRAGGNAFDAILAAHLAACVAEPVLSSLGGGGFLLAKPYDRSAVIYDFFTHTPRKKRPSHELDFRPITVDFGTAQQEFHIGQGTVATPGSVKALFDIHRDLGCLALQEIAQPAIHYAREGVTLNPLQAYILEIVGPIYSATSQPQQIFCRKDSKDQMLSVGEKLVQKTFADTLETLFIEGEDLFYRGEIAQAIVHDCREGGGHLELSDLENYRVIRRTPLDLRYRDIHVLTNPPPSSGGILIAFALKLLNGLDSAQWRLGDAYHLLELAQIMNLTSKARVDMLANPAPGQDLTQHLLDEDYLQQYRQQISATAYAQRGTTHISIIDALGNVASMTVSNGEGCGSIIPDTGIMLNNMLGEEDLNPGGFHQWTKNQRMSSMMAPSLLIDPVGRLTALGSGGSNRIRSALLQVFINLIDFDMDLEAAVHSPRIHLEGNRLSVEGGFKKVEVERLIQHYPNHEVWNELNLFFGGVHSVAQDAAGFSGTGDHRRGGVSRLVD
ncbi:MAG: gamma-glutamyltransferase [Gammaproteobacteria bacterium]|nr:gamma-glutamyltransferase [Gammaproteobacteria bacterium]